jgi:Uma2 family endonuclease
MELATHFISVPDYLVGERISPIRHEYLSGQIFAMSGGSEEHNRIALNLASFLRVNLRGSGCKTFIADMKVRIPGIQQRGDIFYYPDVMVTCDPNDAERYYKTSPCLIIEVLPPSTETLDRREKRLNYQHLSSLKEYVLVYQAEIKLEVYRLSPSGIWELEILGEGDSVTLKSVGLTLTIEDVYDEVLLGG